MILRHETQFSQHIAAAKPGLIDSGLHGRFLDWSVCRGRSTEGPEEPSLCGRKICMLSYGMQCISSWSCSSG